MPDIIPQPDDTQSRCVCQYEQEISNMRAWGKGLAAVLSIALVLFGGAVWRGCDAIKTAGEVQSDIAHIADEQQKIRQDMNSLRHEAASRRETERGEQSQILIQLGRMDARLDGLSRRLERVEEVVVSSNGGRRRH